MNDGTEVTHDFLFQPGFITSCIGINQVIFVAYNARTMMMDGRCDGTFSCINTQGASFKLLVCLPYWPFLKS
jgi:hypothetical protein